MIRERIIFDFQYFYVKDKIKLYKKQGFLMGRVLILVEKVKISEIRNG